MELYEAGIHRKWPNFLSNTQSNIVQGHIIICHKSPSTETGIEIYNGKGENVTFPLESENKSQKCPKLKCPIQNIFISRIL